MAERKKRLKSTPRSGNGPCPQKAPKKNYFATLMETEEGRRLRQEWSRKKRKNPGRPRGVPDGFRKHEIEPIREKARKEATEIVNIMADKFDIESDYAKEASDHSGRGHARTRRNKRAPRSRTSCPGLHQTKACVQE